VAGITEFTYSLELLMKYIGESKIDFQFNDTPFKQPLEGVFDAPAFISMINFNPEGYEYFKTIFKIIRMCPLCASRRLGLFIDSGYRINRQDPVPT